MTSRILVVDDDADTRRALARLLEGLGHEVEQAGDAEEALARLGAFDPALVVTDHMMPGMSGIELIRMLRDRLPDTDVILITGTDDMQTAVDAMKNGAYDYLPKPLDVDAFEEVVERCFRDRRARAATSPAEEPGAERPPADEAPRLVGRSPGMVALYKSIGLVALNRAPVLIRGESGTGKELVARAIHANSEAAAEPFIGVNCTALAEGLLESELFGHVRGAFTGAASDRKGRFELAGAGTIFLDEIGDTTPAFQAKLLRVLQEREFHPVGGERPRRTEARVLAATHRNLEAAVEAGEFREDLYFRLRILELRIPPLRERLDDLPRLAGHFLARAAATLDKDVRGVAPEALAALRAHSWPGNVRELENVVTRAAVAASGPVIRVEHLGLGEGLGATADGRAAAGTPGTGDPSLEAAEAAHVQRILRGTGGNKREAARVLQISRARLDRMVEKYGLVTDFEDT